MARNQKVPPIITASDRNVFFSLTYDCRRRSKNEAEARIQKFPLAVLVCASGRNFWFRTGAFVTESDYEKILKASNKGVFYEVRQSEIGKFNNIVAVAKSLLDNDAFTLEVLKSTLKGKNDGSFSALFMQNIRRLQSENRVGTAENYFCVYKKFSQYFGESVPFSKISPQLAIDFKDRMDKDGLSTTTINIYLRTLRIHCNIALDEGMIKHSQYPFGKKQSNVKIPPAAKRKDSFLSVPEVLKLMEYDTEEHRKGQYGALVCEALNLWLFSYLGNGLNLADMADLKYSNHFFKTHGKELEFVRKKTQRTSAEIVLIYIPVIEPLRKIIERYGAQPQKNMNVFPQILGGETDPLRVKQLVAQFNSNIQDRLKKVCKEQGIYAPVSMTWARHSFNTNLAHKKVPESYISQAMGHSTESITAGYTGMYSTEDRFRYNSLLLEHDKEA